MDNVEFEDEKLTRKDKAVADKYCAMKITGEAVEDVRVEIGRVTEPYEFEPFTPWSMMTVKGLTMEAFCKECIHRDPSRRVCAQGMCGTLERLEGRLWKVEG